MKAPLSTIVFLVVLTLGLSLAVLPEDVAETAFDESETMPFEGAPLFSLVTPRAMAPGRQDARRAIGYRSCALSQLSSLHLNDDGVVQSGQARSALALCCALRC